MPESPQRRKRASLHSRLARISLFLCDVDGVLTDGTVVVGVQSEMKRFNIQDGLGLKILQKEGIKVGWISNRPSLVTTRRARELKIDYLFQGQGSKAKAVTEILTRASKSWAEVCFMGDDVVDLAPLRRAGVSLAPANAIKEVKAMADYVTKAAGGHGAVREAVRLILAAQKKWKKIIEQYSSE